LLVHDATAAWDVPSMMKVTLPVGTSVKGATHRSRSR